MKKNIVYIIFIFCVIFICCYTASAVTLEECKDLALRNSDLLQAYENIIKSSISAHRKDVSSFFPQASAFYEPDYVTYSKYVDFSRSGCRNKVGVVASLDIQKILSNYPQLSKLEIGKNRLIRQIAENEVLRELTQNYYRIYVLLREKQYYVSAQSYLDLHIKDIEGLRAKGVDVKLDLIRANVQLKTLYISVSDINAEIANILAALNSIMNTEYKESAFDAMDAPDMSEVETDQTIFDENVPEENKDVSYIEYIEGVFPQKISSLEQSRLDDFDLKIAREKYRQSKFYFIPSLQGGYEHNAHTIDPSTENNRAFLSFSMDVFDFGQKANEEHELKYAYESQKNLFNDSQRKLKLRIEQLITEIENIRVTYKNAVDNRKNAEKALDTAREYYQQGKIKETDLLSVFSEYMGAKDQSYEIMYTFLAKKAELDSLVRGAIE